MLACVGNHVCRALQAEEPLACEVKDVRVVLQLVSVRRRICAILRRGISPASLATVSVRLLAVNHWRGIVAIHV